MRSRSQRVRATCVCCGGRTWLLVRGPGIWKAEVICHRCNVKKCSARETHHADCEFRGDIDACLRAHGCKSRLTNVDGKTVRLPVVRYQGRR